MLHNLYKIFNINYKNLNFLVYVLIVYIKSSCSNIYIIIKKRINRSRYSQLLSITIGIIVYYTHMTYIVIQQLAKFNNKFLIMHLTVIKNN